MSARLFLNIDVPDIERGVAFYTAALDLRVARRLGPTVVELAGAPTPVYLLQKTAGTAPFAHSPVGRDYGRHWTPVHFDIAVDDLEPAVARAVAAGATAESDVESFAWGRIVYLADPFGHGFCLLQLGAAGYEALAAS
ncbi:MAG TPA: VOC family protein [Polyangia bacterium]|nr:VOC family protein [Polyangia bacterium]